MQAHDHPELRARVRAELLYLTKPKPALTFHQRMALCDLYHQWGRTVPFLSRTFGIPEGTVRALVGEGNDAEVA
jgi:hypothetical protein